MSELFKALRAGVKAASKFQGLVRAAYEAGKKEEIIGCATAIEAAYPVKKEEGKDSNRAERNGFLSALRMALNRTGKEQPEPRKLTIKKVEGAWQLVDEAKAAPTPTEGAESAEGDEAPDMPASMEAQQEALWAAVELVTANLSNKAVRIAIADALKAELSDKPKAPRKARAPKAETAEETEAA